MLYNQAMIINSKGLNMLNETKDDSLVPENNIPSNTVPMGDNEILDEARHLNKKRKKHSKIDEAEKLMEDMGSAMIADPPLPHINPIKSLEKSIKKIRRKFKGDDNRQHRHAQINDTIKDFFNSEQNVKFYKKNAYYNKPFKKYIKKCGKDFLRQGELSQAIHFFNLIRSGNDYEILYYLAVCYFEKPESIKVAIDYTQRIIGLYYINSTVSQKLFDKAVRLLDQYILSGNTELEDYKKGLQALKDKNYIEAAGIFEGITLEKLQPLVKLAQSYESFSSLLERNKINDIDSFIASLSLHPQRITTIGFYSAWPYIKHIEEIGLTCKEITNDEYEEQNDEIITETIEISIVEAKELKQRPTFSSAFLSNYLEKIVYTKIYTIQEELLKNILNSCDDDKDIPLTTVPSEVDMLAHAQHLFTDVKRIKEKAKANINEMAFNSLASKFGGNVATAVIDLIPFRRQMITDRIILQMTKVVFPEGNVMGWPDTNSSNSEQFNRQKKFAKLETLTLGESNYPYEQRVNPYPNHRGNLCASFGKWNKEEKKLSFFFYNEKRKPKTGDYEDIFGAINGILNVAEDHPDRQRREKVLAEYILRVTSGGQPLEIADLYKIENREFQQSDLDIIHWIICHCFIKEITRRMEPKNSNYEIPMAVAQAMCLALIIKGKISMADFFKPDKFEVFLDGNDSYIKMNGSYPACNYYSNYNIATMDIFRYIEEVKIKTQRIFNEYINEFIISNGELSHLMKDIGNGKCQAKIKKIAHYVLRHTYDNNNGKEYDTDGEGYTSEPSTTTFTR